ncbi:MAG TPA: hypothetical protein VGN81_39920 [Pseudonocardiaceae bacterium]
MQRWFVEFGHVQQHPRDLVRVDRLGATTGPQVVEQRREHLLDEHRQRRLAHQYGAEEDRLDLRPEVGLPNRTREEIYLRLTANTWQDWADARRCRRRAHRDARRAPATRKTPNSGTVCSTSPLDWTSSPVPC